MRYGYRELPADVLRRLEGPPFVKDTEDLERKCHEARTWFDMAIKGIDEAQVRRDVVGSSK